MSMLQKLQESDPAQYQQVTQQIATNLQSAAKSAESDGNTTAATQLNQLADDFTKASKTGELPDVADLAKAVGGHHHHMPPPSDSTGDGTSGTSSSSSSSDSASQTLAQLFAMAQYGTSGGSSSTSQDPMAIIMQTLSDAGVSITGA
jgi:hypothetical protein